MDLISSIITGDNNDEIINIVNDIENYDAYDIIKKFSGLNLMPQNQNKSILMDGIIEGILSKQSDSYNYNHKISFGKFKKVICKLNGMSLAYAIDPCENVFAQKVIFGSSQFYVFNGIDNNSSFILQSLIRVLFDYKNDFSNEYLNKTLSLISMILSLSDYVFKQLNIDTSIIEYDENKCILVPSGNIIEELSELITFNYGEIQTLYPDVLFEELCTSFDTKMTGDVQNLSFYTKPFLLDKQNNELIVLNISLLPYLAFYKALEWADSFAIKARVINRFNDFIWMITRRTLDSMGHKKLREDQFGIDLSIEDYYKESIHSAYNNQLMLIFYICDDAKDYSKHNIHSNYLGTKHTAKLNERFSYLVNKLAEYGIKLEDLYVLLVTNSIGRGISIGIENNEISKSVRLIHLHPFELQCIAINEKKDYYFLPRYIVAKNNLNTPAFNVFSELNSIAIYKSNNKSFYVSDDVDSWDTVFYIPSGDSLEYIQAAIDAEDRNIVPSYIDYESTEIILENKERKIYCEDILFKKNNIALYVDCCKLKIWLVYDNFKDINDLKVMYSIVDAISYWLGECGMIFANLRQEYRYPLVFHFNHVGDALDFYKKRDKSYSLNECLSTSIDGNHVYIDINPELFEFVSYPTNCREKELCQYLLNVALKILNEEFDYSLFLDSVFANPIKKKFKTFDYNKKPYMKPIESMRSVRTRPEIEDYLLDLIGRELIKTGKWAVGRVNSSDRYKVTQEVVSLLYKRLEQIVSKLCPKNLLELIYYDIEKVIYDLSVLEMRYSSDIACYPESADDYMDEFNEVNKVSVALRFLAEYITASNPCGEDVLGESVYEELITICSMIIDWAYKGDMFSYGIINTPVEFLKSKRIGMKKDELADIFRYENNHRRIMMNYNSPLEIRKEYHVNSVDFHDDFVRAFKSEFGYDYDDFNRIIGSIIAINEDDVMCMPEKKLLDTLSEMNRDIHNSTIEKIIDDVTYTQRDDFLKLPNGYEKWEAWPWRFNRRYSFNRRSILKRDGELIWGNRQLFQSMEYLVGLIFSGKLKTCSSEMEKLKGKITSQRGKEFNELVYKIIEDMGEFILYSNVKKINRKKISDGGMDLGDIDILVINNKNRTIYAIEVKKFKYSKNPYEIKKEYDKMFDDSKVASFATKHKKRVDWLKSHIDDIKQEYGLQNKKWRIEGLFVVSEPLISKDIFKKDIKYITISELCADSFT